MTPTSKNLFDPTTTLVVTPENITKILNLIIPAVNLILPEHGQEKWVTLWNNQVPKTVDNITTNRVLASSLHVSYKESDDTSDILDKWRKKFQIIDQVVSFSVNSECMTVVEPITWKKDKHTQKSTVPITELEWTSPSCRNTFEAFTSHTHNDDAEDNNQVEDHNVSRCDNSKNLSEVTEHSFKTPTVPHQRLLEISSMVEKGMSLENIPVEEVVAWVNASVVKEKQSLDKQWKTHTNEMSQHKNKNIEQIRGKMKLYEQESLVNIASKGASEYERINEVIEKASTVFENLKNYTATLERVNATIERSKKNLEVHHKRLYEDVTQEVTDKLQDARNSVDKWMERKIKRFDQDVECDDLQEIRKELEEFRQFKKECHNELRVLKTNNLTTSKRFPNVDLSRDNGHSPNDIHKKSQQRNYKFGDVVHYHAGSYSSKGVIISVHATTQAGNTVYSILTTPDQRTFTNCKPSQISPIHTSTIHDNTEVDDGDPDDSVIDILSQGSPYEWKSARDNLCENEFIYPLGTKVKRINTPYMLKNAKDWNFTLKKKEDIKQFYQSLQSRLLDYNIYLKQYEDITKDESLFSITQSNSENSQRANIVMTRALFTYFNDNKDTIFSEYDAPLVIFDAFKLQSDGEGFLKEMLQSVHPNLKPPTEDIVSIKPKFEDYENIHVFVNAFINWLNDEKVKQRHYTDRENISYILENLDDRFDSAKVKITRTINDAVANNSNQIDFPRKWSISNHQLSLDIMKEIPHKETVNVDFTNDIAPKINVMTRSSSKRNQRKFRPSKYEHHDSTARNDQWYKNIKWKYLPGAVCPACGRNDHDIYQTGCPQMAIFCNCMEFYRSHDKRELEPVKQAYNDFMAEQRNKKKSHRSNYRRMIQHTSDQSLKAAIKKLATEGYYEEFPEDKRDGIDLDLVSEDESDIHQE